MGLKRQQHQCVVVAVHLEWVDMEPGFADFVVILCPVRHLLMLFRARHLYPRVRDATAASLVSEIALRPFLLSQLEKLPQWVLPSEFALSHEEGLWSQLEAKAEPDWQGLLIQRIPSF